MCRLVESYYSWQKLHCLSLVVFNIKALIKHELKWIFHISNTWRISCLIWGVQLYPASRSIQYSCDKHYISALPETSKTPCVHDTYIKVLSTVLANITSNINTVLEYDHVEHPSKSIRIFLPFKATFIITSWFHEHRHDDIACYHVIKLITGFVWFIFMIFAVLIQNLSYFCT